MENDSLSALRALMFGEEPHDGPPEPDFQVLVDLAPVLEAEARARLIEEVSMMGMAPRAQFQAVVAMMAYLPGAGGDEILGRAVRQHEAILPYLTGEMIQRTISGLRVVEPEAGYRADMILALASNLPLAQGQAVILAEALGAGRKPNLGYSEQRAIRTLIEGLKEPLSDAVGAELYQIVSALDDFTARLWAQAVLAPLLPEPGAAEVTSQILEAIRAQDEPGLRASLLLEMGKREKGSQQTSLIDEAFAVARSLALKGRTRHALLVEISLYVSAEKRAQVLKEAQRPYEEGLITWPSGEAALIQRFAELAPRVPGARFEALQAEIQKLPLPGNLLDLSPLISHLSVEQFEGALQMFSDPYWDEVMADAFTELALALPIALVPAALDQLAEWDIEKIKCQTLISLVSGLPLDLFPRALEIAAGFETERWRARAAEALAGRSDWTDRSHPIFEMPLPGAQIRRLWVMIPADQQRELLFEVMDRLWGNYGGMEAANGGGGDDEGMEAGDGGDVVGGELVGGDRSGGVKSISPEEPADLGGLGFGILPEMDGEKSLGADIPPEENGGEMAIGGDMPAGDDLPAEERPPVVNTGFAPQNNPDAEIPRERPLVQDQDYYFWLHIGRQKKTAIAADSPEIDVSKLPPEAQLTVALFGFDGELEITRGVDIGVVKILSSRVMEVVRSVSEPANLADLSRLKNQLYFPIRTPDHPGDYRLRCNIYYEQVLLQSHLITAQVVSAPGSHLEAEGDKTVGPPLRHALDYTLTNTLQTEIFTEIHRHNLSLLINDNGNGTHGFRFFGGENGQVVKEDATFTALELQDMIEQARGALRKVAWDTKEPWQPEDGYRYLTKPADAWVGRLKTDLVRFAKWGARFYRVALQKVAESGVADLDEADQRKKQLEDVLRKPGRVQIAAKESSRHVLPAALIYDHPIHDALPSAMYKLCPEFRAALENGDLLLDTGCFQGECPSRGDLTIVCPSGFWGYRHVLGFPVSIGPDTADREIKINYADVPQVSALVSLDGDFKLRDGHVDTVRQLRAGLGWKFGDEGQEILDLMRQEHSHLVYFYCHGGLTEDGVPYLKVGPDDDVFGIITPTLLPNMQIKWDKPKPLVFINGCHTTALEPAKALDLVTSFVKEARAVGVIGTEITIFEPLATAFAEACLGHFLNEVPIGDAIRHARLKLLADGNPLGLVYIPFVVSSVRLVKEGAQAPGA